MVLGRKEAKKAEKMFFTAQSHYEDMNDRNRKIGQRFSWYNSKKNVMHLKAAKTMIEKQVNSIKKVHKIMSENHDLINQWVNEQKNSTDEMITGPDEDGVMRIINTNQIETMLKKLSAYKNKRNQHLSLLKKNYDKINTILKRGGI